ncbi:FHIPEP family type III secretion protein [bacterium]|nr:FHIPEP family type III secretion protein [bacterium]
MEKKQSILKIDEQDAVIKFFSTAEMNMPFVPWLKGERGQQTFLKLRKHGKDAFLYAGAGSVMQAEIQKAIMKLSSDGWTVEGDVQVSFDGAPDVMSDRLLCRDEITVEIGAELLPLVDPCNGSPLLERLNAIREELVKSLGFILPGINVKDNMLLHPNAYVIKFRELQASSFELYLDRMMAIGNQEDLDKVTGWAVTEPTYKMPAKWIESKDRNVAESAGCIVQGALNVMLTHISDTIHRNAGRILGVQETYNLLADLAKTHPILVDEFLQDIPAIRKIRKILFNLLNEKVSISDLVTIMEVIGEHISELSSIDLMTGYVRKALSSQICYSLVDADGFMRAITLNTALEDELKGMMVEALGGVFLKIEDQKEDKLVKMFKEIVDNLEIPPVIVVAPTLRTHIYNILSEHKMNITVLSFDEVYQDIKILFTGEVKGTLFTEEEKKAASKSKEKTIFWSKKINKPDQKKKD